MSVVGIFWGFGSLHQNPLVSDRGKQSFLRLSEVVSLLALRATVVSRPSQAWRATTVHVLHLRSFTFPQTGSIAESPITCLPMVPLTYFLIFSQIGEVTSNNCTCPVFQTPFLRSELLKLWNQHFPKRCISPPIFASGDFDRRTNILVPVLQKALSFSCGMPLSL